MVFDRIKWKKDNQEKLLAYYRFRNKKRSKDPLFKRQKKNAYLKRMYGITLDEYEKMLKEQNGVCKICEYVPMNKALHVDHCHKTGKVRGILCHICNWYLGKLENRKGSLERLVEYLNEAS